MSNLTKPDIELAPFDPSEWLAAWSDNGGLAVLVDDRLYLGRAKALDQRGNERLDQLRAQLIRNGAWEVVTEALRHGMLTEAE